jgi:hypothetical protein
MITKKSGKERRLHPRVDLNLPISVAANGYDFTTNTKNISCLGAYCHIQKYVPPFTRVRIRMNLPMGSNGSSSHTQIECDGVIVRSEDETKGGFNVAIYFNHIKDGPRQKISEYVSQLLN